MNNIKTLCSQKDWESLIANYSPKEVCLTLDFSEAMWLTKYLFYINVQNNDPYQEFALKLAFEIKNHFKEEWEKDWKNEVFLGRLCSILWRYDEQYFCYKRAYDKLEDPPAALLLLLAGCKNAPEPPISQEKAEFYLRKSLQKNITFETALSMRTLCRSKGEFTEAEYWDQLYEKLKKNNTHAEIIIPDVFKESA